VAGNEENPDFGHGQHLLKSFGELFKFRILGRLFRSFFFDHTCEQKVDRDA
jgi:hypothetical protein